MLSDQEQLYLERYTKELNVHFGDDQRRIQHAHKVLDYVLQIIAGEKLEGEICSILIVTALLHDVGIKAAEEKYHSSAGKYQEIEGPPVIREMLGRWDEPQAFIERVAYIVGGHHTSAKNDGLDFQIIWEADLLVNVEEEGLDQDTEKLQAIITKNFRTSSGLRIANQRYSLG
ncbi:MAG: hypothetical protein H6Q67_656 [Firmicutes bacterium]|nr:hypothetical protein [Bacillota bacterium]